MLYAVDGNDNFKDAIYSYAAPLNGVTGALSSIVIDCSHTEDTGIGFASLSRMGVTRQKVSFIFHSACLLQGSNNSDFHNNGLNVFNLALNLIDSSNGLVVCIYIICKVCVFRKVIN